MPPNRCVECGPCSTLVAQAGALLEAGFVPVLFVDGKLEARPCATCRPAWFRLWLHGRLTGQVAVTGRRPAAADRAAVRWGVSSHA